MRKVILACFASLFTGVLAHLIFYPIIEGWNNDRMRNLSRSGIGVLCNTFPMIAWLRVSEESDRVTVTQAVMAYCTSFLWTGAGVMLGYVIGDMVKMLRGK